uniref:tRNA/rRNA methyltransferase SpoU type domain-containing protein n=1 Tax=Arion vulgaris TaxID=1028688 RepID=A0A0B6Z4J1_9EUPU
MSHIIARLHSQSYLCLSMSIQKSSCSYFTFNITSRSYSRQRTSRQTLPADPRTNVRYPYVKGDPIHEDAIRDRKNNNSLSKLKDKDKETDYRKKESMKEHSDVMRTDSHFDSGLKYEKIMDGDIRLGRTILAAKSSQSKSTSDTILLEGQRLIKDALLLGAQAKSIYFCDPTILNDLPHHLLKDVGLYKILYRDMKIWSDATTPAGILGVFQKPKQGEAICSAETTLPITVIFDSLRDPGNAGTLIRTAAAVGCERIIATKGTVNLWDCKVLRSAMGGHFSVPIYTGLSWADIPNYLQVNTQVFLANTWQSSTLTSSFDKKLRSEDLDEELNKGESPDTESGSESDSELEEHVTTKDIIADKNATAFQKVPFSVCEYSDIFISSNTDKASSSKRHGTTSIVLVLGGETEGISKLAKKFAYNYYGQYVSVPMNISVNSLNTSIAGSIILYELRKKLLALESAKQIHRN